MTEDIKGLCEVIGLQFGNLIEVPSFPINLKSPRIRGIVGICVAAPKLINHIPSGTKVTSDELWKTATIQDEPIVALLGQNPIMSDHVSEFTQAASTHGLREALSHHHMFHPVVVALGKSLARLSVGTCLENGYDGLLAIDPEKFPTLLGRLRKHRRVLESEGCFGKTYRDLIWSAIDRLPEARKERSVKVNGKKETISYFVASDFKSIIRSREENSWAQYIDNNAILKTKEVRGCLQAALEFEIEEDRKVPQLKELNARLFWENRGKMPWSHVRQLWSEPYPTPVAQALGPAQLDAFVREVARLDRPEHSIWALLLFGFCPLGRIADFKVFKKGRHWFSRQKVSQPQKRGNARLNRPRIDWLVLPLPKKVALLFHSLRREGRLEERITAARAWAEEMFPRMTAARLSIALTTIGCHIYQLPWPVVNTALFPAKEKVATTKTYDATGAALWPPLETYFKIVDPSFSTPRYSPVTCVNSGLCPRTRYMRGYFGTYRKLLALRLPVNQEPNEIVCLWNAIAAGSNHAVRLDTGLRAYKLDPLLFRTTSLSHGDIVRQKNYFGTAISPKMGELLASCEARRQECEESLRVAGYTISLMPVGGVASMMKLEDGVLSYFEPRAIDMVKAHALHPELRQYKGFAANMVRHFSATVMRELGVEEIEARYYLGHHASALSPFSLFRLEPIILRQIRFRLANMLGREAGLWD